VPHVVIEGEVDLEAWVRDFAPVLMRERGDVLRADRVFVDRERQNVLVEALSVEGGRKQPFYVKISRRSSSSSAVARSVTVRVDPLTHPERSEGVRRLVACLAQQLLDATPGAKVGASNVVIRSAGAEGEPR
jgi:hypothetical protein